MIFLIAYFVPVVFLLVAFIYFTYVEVSNWRERNDRYLPSDQCQCPITMYHVVVAFFITITPVVNIVATIVVGVEFLKDGCEKLKSIPLFKK